MPETLLLTRHFQLFLEYFKIKAVESRYWKNNSLDFDCF